METFRQQSARVESEIKSLQARIEEQDKYIQDLRTETTAKEIDLSKSKMNVEKLRNELET